MTTGSKRLSELMVGGGESDTSRLRLLSTSSDGHTQGAINSLGLPADANCLELAAGAGSVTVWLAAKFSAGKVHAVDIDLSPLPAVLPGNVTAEQHDISSENFQLEDNCYDLIHARYIFSHLANRDEIISRVVQWLKPGGWLVSTEPYHLDADSAAFPVVQRAMQAYENVAKEGNADLKWSRRVPSIMASAGLVQINSMARPGLLGGGRERDRWAPLLAPVSEALVEEGTVSAEDLDELRRNMDRSDFLDIPQVIITTVGRRPVANSST